MTESLLLFRNACVVTLDEAGSVFSPGAVAVGGPRILEVGPDDAVSSRVRADEVIDCQGGPLMPGLVNLHGHAGLAIARGGAKAAMERRPSEPTALPLELLELDSDSVEVGVLLAVAEMIRSGTTTFVDMYHYHDGAVIDVLESIGCRAVLGEMVSDLAIHGYKLGDDRALKTLDRHLSRLEGHATLGGAVAPHSAHTVSMPLLGRVGGLAREASVPILTHAAETRYEIEFTESWFQSRPLALLEKAHLLGPQLVLAHGNLLDARECQRLGECGASVALCTQSASSRGVGHAPLATLTKSSVGLGLGTDDPCAHGSLDLFAEIKATALRHGQRSGGAAEAAMLRMATNGGARAVGRGGDFGELGAGKLADLIVLDSGSPHLHPMEDPHHSLVFSARGSDVVHTMVGGQFLMRDRSLKTIDEEALVSRVSYVRTAVAQTLECHRIH